jgi:hypothetical protein
MKSRIFSVLLFVSVELTDRGVPRSWRDAIVLLLAVLHASTEHARPALPARSVRRVADRDPALKLEREHVDAPTCCVCCRMRLCSLCTARTRSHAVRSAHEDGSQ